jgi:3-(3-hydroxy-phenyl)propionate hydroxylase
MTVVIIGGGPTGITAATLLARYGVPTLVLDRWETVYPQPRAVHLDDEVFRLLGRLGLRDRFAAISRPALGLRLVDRDLRSLAEFRRDRTAGVHGHPQANMFDQPELEELLRANLAGHPEVRLRGGVEVTDVSPAGPGRTRVAFTDVATGREESVSAAFVLGCDGARSVVRQSIGSHMVDLGPEQRWLVVDVETAADLGHWEGVHQVCDPERTATFMRVGEHRYRWEFRLRPDESAGAYADLGALRPLLGPWLPAVDPPDLHLLRCAEYTFRAQIADRWRKGGIFLLGDAAHLTPPFVGQGLGAGLRDAANLCWKLAGVLHGDLPERVLDTYEAERRPHARAMIRLAVTIGRFMTEGGRTGDLLRRVLAPRVHLLPGLRERVLDSATPPLNRSMLVTGSRRHRRLVGTLCPNVELGDGMRFDDHVGDRFALVTAAPLTPRQRAAVEARGAVVVPAADGPLARWLAHGRAQGAVVRPDGAVLLASDDPEQLCAAVPVFAAGSRGERAPRVTGVQAAP